MQTGVTVRKWQEQYPNSDSLKDLADAFGDFLMMKIQKIRTKLDSQDSEPITIPRVPVKQDMFLSFQPLLEDDVKKHIKQSPIKQFSSDPIPTWPLKECLDSLLPIEIESDKTTSIYNVSTRVLSKK